MSLLREKLNRLRAAAGLPAGEGQTGDAAAVASDVYAEGSSAAGSPGSELEGKWAAFGVREAANASGTFMLRRLLYEADERHGRYRIGELGDAAGPLHPLLAAAEERRLKRQLSWPGKRKPGGKSAAAKSKALRAREEAISRLPETVEAGRLLFLDTETTGLGVGAGNVPFMIGIAYWEPDGGEGRLVAEQLFMRHPGEEAAMLEHLCERMTGRDILVTYNGLSFDWPLIRNRFVMNRMDDVCPELAGHLDWLYPSRSLWRNTLESCRLGTVEESKLGVVRIGDLPGSLAPTYYARYLMDGDPEPMAEVFRHNETDLLSLAGLGIHFARLLTGSFGASSIEKAAELLRLGEWLLRHGRPGLADEAFGALEMRDDADKWPLLPALADSYKRRGRHERAVRLWREYAQQPLAAASIEPYVELAMYYEHRTKDYREAIVWCKRAIETVRRRETLLRKPSGASGGESLRELQKRLDRLGGKLRRTADEAGKAEVEAVEYGS